jgi:hypothetical protein
MAHAELTADPGCSDADPAVCAWSLQRENERGGERRVSLGVRVTKCSDTYGKSTTCWTATPRTCRSRSASRWSWSKAISTASLVHMGSEPNDICPHRRAQAPAILGCASLPSVLAHLGPTQTPLPVAFHCSERSDRGEFTYATVRAFNLEI